jgi:hypothetical protein
MILLAHIVIALTTILLSAVIVISPSRLRVIATKISTTATLLSGVYLVVQNSSKLVSSCAIGLMIVAVSYVATKRADAKLAS